MAPTLRTLRELGSGLVLPSYQSVILGKARTLLGTSPSVPSGSLCSPSQVYSSLCKPSREV